MQLLHGNNSNNDFEGLRSLKMGKSDPDKKETRDVEDTSNTQTTLKCIWHEIFISLFERLFKMMKNGVYFIVIAFLFAELFKILVYTN